MFCLSSERIVATTNKLPSTAANGTTSSAKRSHAYRRTLAAASTPHPANTTSAFLRQLRFSRRSVHTTVHSASNPKYSHGVGERRSPSRTVAVASACTATPDRDR